MNVNEQYQELLDAAFAAMQHAVPVTMQADQTVASSVCRVAALVPFPPASAWVVCPAA